MVIGGVLSRFPAARVVAVTEKLNDAVAFPLLRLGVKGLLTNAEVSQRLALAVSAVATGGFWAPRLLIARFLDSLRSPVLRQRSFRTSNGLSRRELEILDPLLGRLSNKEIGSKLHISESTVKFHVSNLLTKFGVSRRTDLIALSWQNQLPAH